MATGDQADVTQRLTALLPPWFPAGASPILNAVLQGPAWVLSAVYSLVQYATGQTRIATAIGGWLDLIAYDFFGRALSRSPGQSDADLLNHIQRELLRPRGTRSSLIAALQDLTGQTATVIEPWRPSDCGAYGYGGLGYGVSGCYGSLALPTQCFVTAYLGNGAADSDIYTLVADTIPAGTTAWTQIST
jgi:hypothetical protein